MTRTGWLFESYSTVTWLFESARHIAKNLVAAGVAEEALVQVAYAIGVAQPVSLYVNTRGTAKINMTDGEISKVVSGIFDMRPNAIENRLKLEPA